MNTRIASRLLLLVSAVTLVAAAPGCGRIKEDKKAMLLESATSAYRQSIRWGYFQSAAGFVHPDERGEIDMDALNNVRVTGYEVIQQPVIGANDQAVQVVQIEYVLDDRQTLKSLSDRQVWRYDEKDGAWWLHSPLPAFTQD